MRFEMQKGLWPRLPCREDLDQRSLPQLESPKAPNPFPVRHDSRLRTYADVDTPGRLDVSILEI